MRGPVNAMILFLTHWAAFSCCFSCAGTGIVPSTAWKQEGITDWAPWTGSPWACQASMSASCRHGVGMHSQRDGEASGCDRCWLNLLTRTVKPMPCVLCVSAMQVWPAKTAWKSCSELGSKNWLSINPGQQDRWLHSLSMFSCGSSRSVARQALLYTGVRVGNLEYFF